MDGHQFRGARIYRDMMLVGHTVVCVVGLSVVSGGGNAVADRLELLHAASVPHTDL